MIGQDELFRRADAWVASYANAEHLRKTVDWLRILDPACSSALLLAGLLHDMERAVPGPDRIDYDARHGPADPAYNRHHAGRSARIVGDWLRAQGAAPDFIDAVADLIVAHEDGGWPEADLLQAADSLSFLDVNVALLLSWLPARKFHTGPAEAREKLDYTLNRLRMPPRGSWPSRCIVVRWTAWRSTSRGTRRSIGSAIRKRCPVGEPRRRFGWSGDLCREAGANEFLSAGNVLG
jgi:hypothetical protein